MFALVPYIAIAVVLAGLFGTGYMKGKSACEIKNEKVESAAVKEGIKKHGKIESDVMSLLDVALDDGLREWYRD